MKRAKRAIISYRKIPKWISSYHCPHCKVYVDGAGIGGMITRFLCHECGEEIIVVHNIK